MTGMLKGALTGFGAFAVGFAVLAVILPPEVPLPEPARPAALVAAPESEPSDSLLAAAGGLPAAPVAQPAAAPVPETLAEPVAEPVVLTELQNGAEGVPPGDAAGQGTVPAATEVPAPVAVVPGPDSGVPPIVEAADPSPQRVAEPGNVATAPGLAQPSAVDDTVRLGPPGVGNAAPPPAPPVPEASTASVEPTPQPEVPAPVVEAAPTETEAATPAPEAAPQVPAASAAEAVPTRRLPQIGVPPTAESAPAENDVATLVPQVAPEAPAAPAAEVVPIRRLPQIGVPLTDPDGAPAADPALGAEAPAWQRFRAAGQEPGERPPLGLVLFDPARALETEAALVEFPVPVTVALDPFDPDAPRRAQVYRAAGHELVLAIDGIASGATASDLEVLLEAWARDFPEALGLIELPPGEGRRSRALAPVVIPALAARGLALVAPDRGLSPMLAAGRAAGLPLAGLYRALDAADEDAGTIRRQLDRAAFEAERLGRIAVFARADRAVTRAAILDWLAGGGRAARVATGAAGAVLAVP